MKRSPFVVPLCVAFLFVIGCDKAAPPPDPIRPVRAMKVGDLKQLTGRPYPGQAAANEEVDLSFRVGGPLIELPVKAGETIKQNALVAKIDPRDYEVKILTQQGELASVDASLKNATLEYETTKKLFEDRAADKRELDRRKATMDLYTGQKKALEAKLEAANDELKYTFLRAPFEGLVATTYVENFQTVKPQQAIVRLLDLSKVKFEVDLPEKAMPLLKHVNEVIVTIQSFPGREFPAKVHEVANEASRLTRTYRVTLVMDQPSDVRILPGMTGDARAKSAVTVVDVGGLEVLPSAVFENVGKSYVWLYDETTKRVKQQEIKPKRMTGSTVLVEGLTVGQWVVTAGVHFLKEGQEVRLLDDEKAATQAPAGPAVKAAPAAGSAAR